MTISADDSGPVRIVTAVLRDGDRVLLCHRSAGRRWYPDVWDLPGGHVEAWFMTSDLDSLRLAHEPYLSMLTAVLVT
ncbi:NUDIX hydrolase [Nonomuraea sp. CA-141351]|uniref:NUDIX hydrolase n=1 Tax=Nonomuraea sp. CA-141351 TaxID=3239996 RepID=UPI003D91EEE4